MSRKAKPVPSIDLAQVEWLAQLSRLSLSGSQAEHLRGELSSILDYFATLDRVDLARTPTAPREQAGGGGREDMARPSEPDEVLKGVPERRGRYVKAPKVF